MILSLTIKQFAVEAYKVPSGSMEPAIIGKEIGGDRILVNKLAYLFREPRRWEVVVFRYPNNRSVNYIKRIVGMPNETLFIIGGDIYVAPHGSEPLGISDLYASGDLRCVRKPPTLQNAVFERYPQIDAESVAEVDDATLHRYWIVPPPALPDLVEWSTGDGRVRGRSGGRSTLRFRDRIRDNRKFEPPSPTSNGGGQHEVSDVRIKMRVRPLAPGGTLRIELRDQQHDRVLIAKLPVQGGSSGGGIYVDQDQVIELTNFDLPVDKWTDLSFANVDDSLVLRLDGEVVARHEYRHFPERAFRIASDSTVSFGVDAADIEFERLAVERDLHYQNSGFQAAEIDEGHYYVLGDNSPSSKDSREWQRMVLIPEDGRELRGDSEAVLDPSDLNSRIENPWKRDGIWRFMDEFGNVHILGESLPAFRRELSPLVPRHLIMGRAFAVFLPIQRTKLVR